MNLTKPQKLIYDMEKFAGGSISVICGSMLVDGKKDLSELKRAVNEIYRLNDALRIHISEVEGEIYQTVTDYKEQDIKVLCFENKAEFDSYAESYAKLPLDFYGSLSETKIIILPEQYGILIKLHHIIGDAWTLSLLGTQFNAILKDETPEIFSYIDYAKSETAYLQSKRYEKDKSFFLEQFKKCDEVTYLREKQTDILNAQRKTFIIDTDKTKQITEYAMQNNTSAFMLFTTALSTYISRTKMNVEKFYIGTASLNRSNVRERNTAGMFINTVPMLIELDNTKSFAENLSRIEDTAFSVFRHQKYNYSDILSAIRTEYNFGEKLYDILISYQNATVAGTGFETTWYHNGAQSESLQIHIDDRDNDSIFRIHYDYQTEKFTEEEIKRLHQHICHLLFDAIENDKKKPYELELLTADEQQKLLYTFNDTKVDYPRDKCFHQLFEEQVEKTPDKVAVIACDKTLTYKVLNEQANCIAHSLIEKGIGVGDIVAFMLPRRSYLIAVMLGILKSGAAYLPIDPDYPQDRIDYMLSDSKAKLFITEVNISELLDNSNKNNPCISMTSEDLCYCIYTSGSTGKPKGTLLAHGNVVNYVNNNNNNVVHRIIKDSYKNIVSVTTVGFDIFVTESLLPLANGMEIIFASEEQAKFQSELNLLIKQNPADVIQTTPTKMKSLIADKQHLDYLKTVKLIILGGEALEKTLVEELGKITEAEIFNNYGPTETTVWSTNAEIKEDDITIGKPIANTQIYIVDKYMRSTPIGVTGELCIAGDGVGAGYLNRPELTAEKFIDNPFGKGKLYKTGDLAYWREDGNIVYVGRNDFQVKIRGLRIELGEIESAICGIDGISQAVVVVRKNTEGRQLICAFYTGVETEAKVIRSHIGNKLPKYMLPHIFTRLDEMPLTSSGKINRKALPEIDLENITNDTEYVAPENEQQRELCKIIENVLNTSPVGITDDLFDLGCDSLKAIELVSKAHNEGIYFNLQNIFDYPTVKSLSECIESGDRQNISFADIDYSETDKVLAKNKIEYISEPKNSDVGNILLAGATGYLGIHILADFLNNDTGTAFCLVRGKDKDDSIKRLQEMLNFYFGDEYSAMHRIEVICADLQKNKFGLTDIEYEKLTDTVDTVINCAASVKHYGSYKYFYDVNVETTKRLIEFCKNANAKLIHTSTISVSGNSFADEFSGLVSDNELDFSESSLYIGQPLGNVYARSKFEAEKTVLDEIANGLSANIMRMGMLTNRFSDGVFQKNLESNAFLKRLKSIIELGVFPDYLLDLYAEFTPIDEAAKAVMTIVRHFNSEQTVFHINNPKVVYLRNLIEYFVSLGFQMKVINGNEFSEVLRHNEHILENLINDLDENNRLNYNSNIHINNDFTVRYLRTLGFEWSDIDINYIRRYVEYFRKNSYFKLTED